MKNLVKMLVIGFASMMMLSPVYATEFTPYQDATSIAGLAGSLCKTMSLPLSYTEVPASLDIDSTKEISIFVRKFPAPGQSKGTVWLVSGGPGESGASLYAMVSVLRQSFPDFYLILPDHRGTGYSTRLCPLEEGSESPGGMSLVGAEWGTCFKRILTHPDLAKVFTITNAAYDLRHLIAESDKHKPVYLYGVSYGTQLILRALQIGPLAVNGMILDSLVPMQTDLKWDLSHRSHLVDEVGRKVLAECDVQPECHSILGESAEQSYVHLLAAAQKQPELVTQVPGKNLKHFFGSLLDIPKARARIPFLIKDLAHGGNVELQSVISIMKQAGSSLGDFPQLTPSIPLVSIISTSENNLRPKLSLPELRQEEQGLLFTSRLPEMLIEPALPTYSHDKYFGKLPQQLPPMLVFSGTLDPKTSYEGALNHVDAIRKTVQASAISIVSVIGAPHFTLWVAPSCFIQHAKNFVEKGISQDQRCEMTSTDPVKH
ncbi:alpha/beta fold hydrolase [Undibacterium jejuense]|uniref:Alpha/beta fold hydrolase n=1 Tax=Undibacterium jejuense TaxID=1344949 RepID=A0A923HMG4_9BURK|nr:alpha/beta fold hydrolase [Undibacterium jejuense]MBC3862311.1 alpha/beta fold hydrolase [Undibacterium jejuense]